MRQAIKMIGKEVIMAAKNIIKVFVIDDSLVFDKFLSQELPKASPNIQVIGYSTDPIDALRKIPQLEPDVITLDVEMPRMDGISFLKELLPKHPIPVILASSLNVNVFDALSYGAVDFVKKPDMSRNYNAQVFAQSLVSKIIIASRATVHQPKSIIASRVRYISRRYPPPRQPLLLMHQHLCLIPPC